jgi:hypothetical protein
MKTKLLLATAVACFFCASVTMAQTVPSYVPTNGLVGWWPFDGNANDESGNGNNGIVNGATLTADRFGNIGSAYSFNGINQYIEGNINSISNTSNTTVAGWLFYTGNAGGQPYDLFFQLGQYGNHTFAYGYNYSGQNLDLYSQCFAFNPYTNIDLNNSWHHIAICDSEIGTSIYIDGQLIQTVIGGPVGNCFQGSSFYFIGGGANNQFVTGKLDDFCFWNRTLTQQEITALYNAQPCTKPEPVSLGTSMSTELCPNEAVTIKIVSPADSANYTYQWTRNGTNMVGATTRSITVNDAAKYKVFVRSGPGVDCQRVSGLVETTPSIPPVVTATAPNGTAYCPGDSVLMTATGATAGYSYRWKRFGVVIPGANSNTYYATQTGNYRCEIFNAGGCITQSNLISITNGTSCRIMGETNSDVSVYPNPAKNSFTVSFNDIGNETPLSVSLRSMQGQVIENRKLASKEDVQFAVGKLSPGLYMVSILLDSGDSIEKTVVVE